MIQSLSYSAMFCALQTLKRVPHCSNFFNGLHQHQLQEVERHG